MVMTGRKRDTGSTHQHGPTSHPVDATSLPGIQCLPAAGNSEQWWFWRRRTRNSQDLDLMAEGTIKRLTDKGFGFIEVGGDKDLFFHMSNLDGVRFEELREGQRVSFTEGRGPKGPRAENVRPV